ncbi:MAG: helix-turn-helix transcriptional regulator [Acidimicrobiales bacterium]
MDIGCLRWTASPRPPPSIASVAAARLIVLTTFQADRARHGAAAGADGFLLETPPRRSSGPCPRGGRRSDALAIGHPDAARRHLAGTSRPRRRVASERLASLTDREREVAMEVGSGASNAEIAASLFMSEATVKAHVSRLLTKLDATNRVQIAILVHGT